MTGKTKFKLFVIITLMIIGALFIIFNEDGVLRYMELKKEVDGLQIKIDSMSAENKRLEQEIDSLVKKIPAKIERTAREKYDMLRKGETKIEIIEK